MRHTTGLTGTARVAAALVFVAAACGTPEEPDTNTDAGTVTATLSSIAIAPATAKIGVGESTTLVATGTFSDGKTSTTIDGLTWTSSAPTVAAVAGGVVSALSIGTATVTASASGKTATAEITVALSTSPSVFKDGYGAGVSFLGFGGAVNDVTIDTAEKREARATLKFVVPTTSYGGGTFVTENARDLSGYNALTFWAKASKAATFDTAGIGNDNADSPWAAEIHAFALTTDWQKFTIPLPLPAKLTSNKGVFHLATGGTGYTVWLSDVQYEALAAGTIGAAKPLLQTGAASKEVGATTEVKVDSVTFKVGTADVKLSPVAPRYFTFASSDATVATVDEAGKITAVKLGTADITAKLGDVAAEGKFTITVTAPIPLPTTLAAAPTRGAGQVISLYSAAYTNKPVNTWRTDWTDGRTTLAEYTIEDHKVKQYKNLYFAGIEFTGENTINASGMSGFHIDLWTGDSETFKVKLVDFGADGNFGGGDDKEHEIVMNAASTPKVEKGKWVALEMPFELFTGLTTRGHLAQLIISGPEGGTVFIDNVYFYNDNT